MSNINLIVQESLSGDKIKEHLKKYWKEYLLGAGITGAAIGSGVVAKKAIKNFSDYAKKRADLDLKNKQLNFETKKKMLDRIDSVSNEIGSGYTGIKNKIKSLFS